MRNGSIRQVAKDHPLAAKVCLEASDFAAETLISYQEPDDMLDLLQESIETGRYNPQGRG